MCKCCNCICIGIAKLCHSIFQRQIALYSPCRRRSSSSSSSRFVTINSTSIKPSMEVRNLTYVHHIGVISLCLWGISPTHFASFPHQVASSPHQICFISPTNRFVSPTACFISPTDRFISPTQFLTSPTHFVSLCLT